MTNLSRAIQLDNKGQAMVEMAFVIFLLVLLVFGMTEFGRAMYTKNTLNNAARAGARAAVVTSDIANAGPVPLNADCTSYVTPCTANNCIYQGVCNNIVAGIDKTTVQVTVSGVGNADKAITVQVQAPFNPVLDLMRRMIGGTLSGQTTMRYE
jgi:Flp pilus assembly protein TadG